MLFVEEPKTSGGLHFGDRIVFDRAGLLYLTLGERGQRLVLDGEKVAKEERLLKGALGRIRDVRVGPDGLIYLLTDESRGLLARLEP